MAEILEKTIEKYAKKAIKDALKTEEMSDEGKKRTAHALTLGKLLDDNIEIEDSVLIMTEQIINKLYKED